MFNRRHSTILIHHPWPVGILIIFTGRIPEGCHCLRRHRGSIEIIICAYNELRNRILTERLKLTNWVITGAINLRRAWRGWLLAPFIFAFLLFGSDESFLVFFCSCIDALLLQFRNVDVSIGITYCISSVGYRLVYYVWRVDRRNWVIWSISRWMKSRTLNLTIKLFYVPGCKSLSKTIRFIILWRFNFRNVYSIRLARLKSFLFTFQLTLSKISNW